MWTEIEAANLAVELEWIERGRKISRPRSTSYLGGIDADISLIGNGGARSEAVSAVVINVTTMREKLVSLWPGSSSHSLNVGPLYV